MEGAYHYTGCGLPDVWLIGGYEVRDTPYGKSVSFHDLDGLHRVIGLEITRTARSLTGAEVRFLRTEFDWSQRMFADFMGVKEITVRKWESGGCRSGPAVRMICALYREHVGGGGNIRQLVDELARMDRAEHESKLCFRGTDQGWQHEAA